MNQIIFIIVIAIIIIGVAYLSHYYSPTSIIKRKLRTAPTRSMAQCKNGETVKVIGTAELVGEPLISPLSGRECCHYHVLIEHKEQRGKYSKWETIIEDEASAKYVISNNGYYAYIMTETTTNHIVKDREFKSGLFNDAQPHLEAYLLKHGHDSENYFGMNKSIRYHEGVIEDGETVAVLGRGEWRSAESLDMPSSYDKILCITPDYKTNKILLSDDKTAISGV